DLNALIQNVRSFREFVGEQFRIIAVIKADAYGHGARKCAEVLEKDNVDMFAVAIPEEGILLRDAGVTKPIICFGGFWEGQEESAFSHNITPVIIDLENAKSLDRVARKHKAVIPVHLKIDTGMGRVGFRKEDIRSTASALVELTGLRVEGLMTHFAAADDPSQAEFTQIQIQRFENALETFREFGHRPEFIDLANSPASVTGPPPMGNALRPGGLLYGLEDYISIPDIPRPSVTPVLSLFSRIAQVKTIPAGESIGYGRSFTAARESLIATIPIGYADGLPRSLSNKGHVIVNGRRVPIVGRVSMDWTTIDVTDLPAAARGDLVTLIGRDGDEHISAVDIAQIAGTISYEITCGVTARVPKFYNLPYQ
ncbi:MAG: alanine racemase, partial [Acidobacteriota bacterium]